LRGWCVHRREKEREYRHPEKVRLFFAHLTAFAYHKVTALDAAGLPNGSAELPGWIDVSSWLASRCNVFPG
jgi:hypothetical protein